VTGRFLSADPYVPNPRNTQDYNRYSYVDNNPLTYIDPTGFDCSQEMEGDHPCPSQPLEEVTITGQREPEPPPPPPPPLITPSLYPPGAFGGPLNITPSGGTGGGPGPNTKPPDKPAKPAKSDGSDDKPKKPKVPYNPLWCAKHGIGCDPNPDQDETTLCFGSFAFTGLEGDVGVGSVFVGAITESSMSGIDVGPLYEVTFGGEAAGVGGAVTQSLVTGQTSGFVFAGVGLTAGPLAAGHLGVFLGPRDAGVYVEGHRGFVAGGVGFGVSICQKPR
jgi:hypothetical protein